MKDKIIPIDYRLIELEREADNYESFVAFMAQIPLPTKKDPSKTLEEDDLNSINEEESQW